MWLVIGLVLGTGLVLSLMWLRSHGVKTAWYQWLIAAAGLLLIAFSIENARTSLAEFERVAAQRSILIFGLPGLVLVILAGLLIWLRARPRSVRND